MEFDLYHATERSKALKIIEKQNFIVKDDVDNNLYLGTGAYFYFNKMKAVDWNSRNVKKNNGKSKLFPSYIELMNRYTIISTTCNVEEGHILDLDTRDALIKYKLMVNKLKNFVEPYILYKDKHELATILNFLYKYHLLDNIFLVIRTFSYPIDKKLGMSLPKRIVCVKKIDILSNYREIKMTKDEYKDLKLLFE